MKRVVLACLLLSLPLLGGKSVVDVGSDRQLFLDRDLIDEMRGAEFELHRPVLREEVLRYDKPWEGGHLMASHRDPGRGALPDVVPGLPRQP